jgi:hypothetical protein
MTTYRMIQCRECGRHVREETVCAFCGADPPKLPPDPQPVLPPADPPPPIPYDGPVPMPAYGGPPGRRLVPPPMMPTDDAQPGMDPDVRRAAQVILFGALAFVVGAAVLWLIRAC